MSVREGRGVGRMTGRGRSGLYEKYERSYLILKVSRVRRRVHTAQSEESLDLSSVRYSIVGVRIVSNRQFGQSVS